MASRIIPVEGRLPGPPTTTVAPASSNSFSRPGPAATATTWRPFLVGVRRPRAASTCSAKCVTRIRCGRPAAIPASTAAPTSSVWTWTFQSPSPPTTTSESPRPARACLRFGTWASSASSRYITSYAGPSGVRSGCSTPDVGIGIRCAPMGAVTGVGRRPVSTVSAASRITLRPRPPASTTPASRSTASWSGVRASASRAAAAASVKTSRARAPGCSARASAASAAARITVRMVPSTGVPTAAYAPSVASRSARAMMLALRSSAVAPAMVVATAPSIWLRITPLLPRAPRRAPRRRPARPARRSPSPLLAERPRGTRRGPRPR